MRAPAGNEGAPAPRRALGLIARKYLEGALAAAKNQLAYRAGFLGSILGFSLFVFIFINLWTAVFSGGKEIAGYTRESAIWYFIVAELAAFGASGAFWGLAEDVKTGAVAYGLGRPYNYVFFQFAQNMGNCLPQMGVMAVFGLAYGFISAGPIPGHPLIRIGATALSLVLAASASFFIQASISLTAFWFKENSAFYWIYQKFILVLGTLMPIEFLPAGLQGAARLLPTSQVAYAPARIASLASAGEALSILGIQAAWTAVMACVALFVFSRGVRRVSIQGG
jgi:ABC-2 type transport system permease protein